MSKSKVAAERRLSSGQIKILTALNKKGRMTRVQIAEEAVMDQSGFCVSIGYIGGETNKKYATGNGLYERDYVRGDYKAESVKGSDNPRNVWYDEITAAGRKALEKALAEQKEKGKPVKTAAKKETTAKPAKKATPTKKRPTPVRKATPAPSPAEAAAI